MGSHPYSFLIDLSSAMTLPPHAATLEQLLILAGPTASGKTGLAIELAQRLQQADGLPVEIISVDSALVFEGMDIGTAKPSAAEQAAVPHHLLDIRPPEVAYSAADFVRDTTVLVADIRGRGAFPLLVGGTMLYIHALLRGLDDLPQADAAIRAELEHKATAIGWPGMHAWLAEVDAPTAARLAPNDSQRIGRALEVWRITGQPISSFQTQHQQDSTWLDAWMPKHLVSLEPEDRAWLHARIGLRFDLMMKAGFLDEMHTLRQRPNLVADMPSMRSVGYRQAWQMLEGEISAGEMPERATIATRQLAKRQITWLRSMKGRHILASDTANSLSSVSALREMVLRIHDC